MVRAFVSDIFRVSEGPVKQFRGLQDEMVGKQGPTDGDRTHPLGYARNQEQACKGHHIRGSVKVD
jgi:hypothetical protein